MFCNYVFGKKEKLAEIKVLYKDEVISNHEDMVLNNDILTIFIHEKTPNKMGLKINNVDKNTQTTFMMNLLDISNEEISIPPATFETELTLPSTEFKKIISDNLSW